MRYLIAKGCLHAADRLLKIARGCYLTSIAKSYISDARDDISMAIILTPTTLSKDQLND